MDPFLNTLEVRVVSLEEAGYFQEKRLKDMDQALLAQQAQIDKLEKQLDELRKQLAGLRDDIESQTPVNEPPPHYNQEK